MNEPIPKADLVDVTSELANLGLDFYLLYKSGRQDYDKLQEQITENDGVDPLQGNLSKPFDPDDYPALSNVTFDTLVKEFGDDVNCDAIVKEIEAKDNDTSVEDALKTRISSKVQELKPELDRIAFQLRFPEKQKDLKTSPSGTITMLKPFTR